MGILIKTILILTILGLGIALVGYRISGVETVPNENLAEGNPESSDNYLKEKLTSLQYHVTQDNGTEKPFLNKYWNNKEEGIYVDVVSGEPLFSSKDKFLCGSGWPSFTKPLEPKNIIGRKDPNSLGGIEVRSKHADSHLGHVFDDGPEPTGKRYCINSAGLRFILKENLEEEGYGEYLYLFEGNKAQN